MRAQRVTCKLCGNRGSKNNKLQIGAFPTAPWLCKSCIANIMAFADPSTLKLALRLQESMTKKGEK